MRRQRHDGGAPTTAELERALRVAAALVVDHGEAAVPLFERLEAELAAARARAAAAARAHALVGG